MQRYTLALLCALTLGGLPAAAQSGHALYFTSAEADRVTAPLSVPVGPVTLAAWVYYDAAAFAGDFNTILEFDTDEPWFGVDVTEGTPALAIFGGVIKGGAVPVRRWVHVAYTWDGAKSRLYLDGAQVAVADTHVPPGEFTGPLGIGFSAHSDDGDTGWQGGIDEVMVWSEARTAAEIRRDRLGLAGGDLDEGALRAYFRFEEDGGQAVVNAADGPDGRLGTNDQAETADPARLAVPSLSASAVGTEGLVLWLRADQGVAADGGGRVTRWGDRSGNGNDALATGAAASPRLDPDGANEQPTVRFDGDGEYLRVADASELKPATLTLFVVGQMDDRNEQPPSAPFVVKTTDFNWSDGYGLARLNAGTTRNAEFFVQDWSAARAEAPLAFNRHALYTGRYDGAEIRLYRDGTLEDTSPYEESIVHTAAPLLLGASPDMKGTDVQEFLYGGIAEVLLFGRALTNAERAEVEAYLSDKYALGITTAAEGDAPEETPSSPLSLTAAPNPVRGGGRLALTLAEAGPARVEVFDALGRHVAVVHDGPLAAGAHALPFDASALPAGVYLVRATANDGTTTQTVTVAR